MPEKKCTGAIRVGRLKNAQQFRLAAEFVEEGASGDDDLNDAYITMCIHAGIAAADVICCKHLNVHHQGENHDEAITMLRRVDRKLAADLETLLRKKTASGYSEQASSGTDRKQAKRAMERLVDAAEAAAG